MSTCVIVFKEKQPAQELVLNLREAQTPFLNCDFIEPLNNKMESETINLDSTEKVFINEIILTTVIFIDRKLGRFAGEMILFCPNGGCDHVDRPAR